MALKVNGQIIPAEAIEYELGRLIRFYSEHMAEEEIRKQMDVLMDRAREQAIGAKLLIDEAARLDIECSEKLIDEKLTEMVENAGGQEKFEALIKEQELDLPGVRESIARGCKVDLLVDKITEGISDPTEEDMREHFKVHHKEYMRPERSSAQHILIGMENAGEAEKATARSRLEEIRREIGAGASFGDQATMHSDCPSGKKTGGSLGWFGHGTMVKEFDDAVFSMEVGELSELVETDLGIHLIYKTGHQEGTDADYDEVQEKIRDFLRHAARGEALSAHVKELKEKATIEESE
jgi:peptidyl-prolyl cis-trans isomerase C